MKSVLKRSITLLIIVLVFVTFLLPAVIPLQASASTHVGGQITSDMTWTKANSPYIVTSSVLVSEGVTLTIESGVAVRFNPAKAIQIDGELIAQGTEAEPIVFTSNQPSPAPGDWINILFTDTSVDAIYDDAGNYLSGSVMQYCTVEYSGGSDTPAIKVVSSSPFIEHCTVKNNARAGIYLDNSSAKISNNDIRDNADVGGGWGIYTVSADADIVGNHIVGNGSGGIYADGTGMVISGNTIECNKGTGIHSRGGAAITENTVRNNEANGICISMGGVVNISDNVVAGNLEGGIVALGSDTIISGNTITSNRLTEATIDVAGAGITISLGGTAAIQHNTIAGNAVISGDNGGGIDVCGQPTITISCNNFQANTPYEVYNRNPQGSANVDATNNWWGTGNEADIQAKLYDWGDDASLGVVAYSPYLTSPSSTAPPLDTTAPTTPVVTDDGDSTTSTTQLHAIWSSSDAESGIAEYRYAIGTSAGGTDTVDWTSAGTNTEVTHAGLNLTVGTTYYFAVKAKNGHGLWSEVGVSDGIKAVPATFTKTVRAEHEVPVGEPAYAEMTVSYNLGVLVGVDENGEEIYVISQVNCMSQWFVGYYEVSIESSSGTIWKHRSVTIPLPFNPHGSPLDFGTLYMPSRETNEGIMVYSSDWISVKAYGVTEFDLANAAFTLLQMSYGVLPTPKTPPFFWESAATYLAPEYIDTSDFPTIDIEDIEILPATLGHLCSPGELRVYDSQGRVTGLLNGEIKQGIPNSAYFNGSFVILLSGDSYYYEVAGTETGNYNLGIISIQAEKANVFGATDIPITPEAIHKYTIDWDDLSQGRDGVTVQIDSKGDGTFEKSISANNELTQDEFASGTAEEEAAGLPLWIWIVAGVVVALIVGILFGRRLAKR